MTNTPSLQPVETELKKEKVQEGWLARFRAAMRNLLSRKSKEEPEDDLGGLTPGEIARAKKLEDDFEEATKPKTPDARIKAQENGLARLKALAKAGAKSEKKVPESPAELKPPTVFNLNPEPSASEIEEYNELRATHAPKSIVNESVLNKPTPGEEARIQKLRDENLPRSEEAYRQTEEPTPGEVAEFQRRKDEVAEKVRREVALNYLTNIFKDKEIKANADQKAIVRNIVDTAESENWEPLLIVEIEGQKKEMTASKALKLNPEILMTYLKENFSINQKITFYDEETHQRLQGTVLKISEDNEGPIVLFQLSDGDKVTMSALDFFKLAPEISGEKVSNSKKIIQSGEGITEAEMETLFDEPIKTDATNPQEIRVEDEAIEKRMREAYFDDETKTDSYRQSSYRQTEEPTPEEIAEFQYKRDKAMGERTFRNTEEPTPGETAEFQYKRDKAMGERSFPPAAASVPRNGLSVVEGGAENSKNEANMENKAQESKAA